MNESHNPREAKHPVEQIAEAVGGTITDGGILPDGSGFAVMSMPLRKDHWIYGDRSMERKVCDAPEGEVFHEPPPMVFKMGARELLALGLIEPSQDRPGVTYVIPAKRYTREQMAQLIRVAGKYAVRAATMKGKEMDFDPDALLQNLVVGFLGYWTENGLTSDEWANPTEPTPTQFPPKPREEYSQTGPQPSTS